MRRAVVLGGGGVTGIGWELGVVAGLADGGVDLREADLFVGTSAGSVVGACVAAGVDPEALFASQLAPPVDERAAAIGFGAIFRMVTAMVGAAASRPRRLRRLGSYAERASDVPEADRVAIIRSRLPTSDWPARPLKVAAVDTATGERRVFERGPVPLADAVAASCAVPGVWPPVTIEGRRYMDGGTWSPVNADLADGYDRVVVLAPTGFEGALRAELAALSGHPRFAVVRPDAASKAAIGRNVLDPSRRAASARAGRDQGARVAHDVAQGWRD